MKATVKVELNGSEKELVPSLAALEYLNKEFGNIQAVLARLGTFDFEVYPKVLYAGLLHENKRSGTVEAAKSLVWETGMTELLQPFIRFVIILLNGGKEPEEEAKASTGEASE